MSKQVTPIQGLWAGWAAFVAGAILAGGFHFAGTAKLLEAEGIARTQRLRAIPIAAKALAVSTAFSVGVGTVALVAFRSFGLGPKSSAEIAGVHEAVSLAGEQRALVREQFRRRLHQWYDIDVGELPKPSQK